jgi:glutathione S-transferase
MRGRSLRCFAALEKRAPHLGTAFGLAQITMAVACGYHDWRYASDDWRTAAPRLAAWFDVVAERASMQATRPAETPQA